MKKDFSVDETKNNIVVGTPIFVGTEFEMEKVECPYCASTFAVDAAYLDQVSEVVHCPMCCLEVEIAENQDN